MLGACTDSFRALGTKPSRRRSPRRAAVRGVRHPLRPERARAEVRRRAHPARPGRAGALARLQRHQRLGSAADGVGSRALRQRRRRSQAASIASKTRPTLTPAARPGRHAPRDRARAARSESIYRWDTRVDLALGSVTAEEMSVLISALFARAGGTHRAPRCATTIAPRFRARRRRSATASLSTRCMSRPARRERRASRSPPAFQPETDARHLSGARAAISTSISVPRSTTSCSPTGAARAARHRRARIAR